MSKEKLIKYLDATIQTYAEEARKFGHYQRSYDPGYLHLRICMDSYDFVLQFIKDKKNILEELEALKAGTEWCLIECYKAKLLNANVDNNSARTRELEYKYTALEQTIEQLKSYPLKMSYIQATIEDKIFQDLIEEKSNLQIKEMLDQKYYPNEIAEIDKKIKERGDWLKQNLKTS